jgi:hypothetical protein
VTALVASGPWSCEYRIAARDTLSGASGLGRLERHRQGAATFCFPFHEGSLQHYLTFGHSELLHAVPYEEIAGIAVRRITERSTPGLRTCGEMYVVKIWSKR